MILLNSENNPVLNNGCKAFDLRSENNRMCQWGQRDELIIETPTRFGGGQFLV